MAAEEPESGGALGPSGINRGFSPEAHGGFRDKKGITVRHVEIARKLAISETLESKEQMRQRLEALMMLGVEDRRRHKIKDDDYAKALEIFGVLIAFEKKEEVMNGGFKMISIPFTEETELEVQRGFEEWLEGPVAGFILEQKDHLTPETAAKLETKFIKKCTPWVLRLTAGVSDAIQLNEFDAAAGKISIKPNQ